MLSFLSTFNFSSFSKLNLNFGPGVLFTGLILVALLIYGLSLGRTRAVVSFLGVYIAYAVYSVFPFWDWLHKTIKFSPALYLTQVGFFLVAYLMVFLILNKSLVKNRMTIGEASFFAVGIISVLQLGLLMTIILNILSVDVVAKIVPAYLARYFITPSAMFYWFIAPIPALLLVRRERERD